MPYYIHRTDPQMIEERKAGIPSGSDKQAAFQPDYWKLILTKGEI